MKKWLIYLLIPLAVLAIWLYRKQSSPPEVAFSNVKRETLVSTLETNGKVEPLEWVAVRADQAGLVNSVSFEAGQQLNKGAALAQLDTREAQASLAAAETRISQAQAELELLEQGGPPVELAEIKGSLDRAQLELELAKNNFAALERLEKKQAATRKDVEDAGARVQELQIQIQSQKEKLGALVSQSDRKVAQARLREAETAASAAQRRIQQSLIRAPIPGVIYDKQVRAGSYLNLGDPVARIGQLEKVRVYIYVDEPELGRVSSGMPVTITWDALPGRQWKGAVERMPTQVVPVGTRQVGEVVCVIDNPDLELLPGTNVNAEVRSSVVENALTIPREAIRRQSDTVGVYVLEGDRIVWREVALGVSNVTRAQIVEGLAAGESVALPTEFELRDGARVKPVSPE